MGKISCFFWISSFTLTYLQTLEKKTGVELTKSLFIDVTIPKPAPTLKVSQIFVLPIPRLGNSEGVKGESEKLRNMTRSNQTCFIWGSRLFGCYQLEAVPPTQRDNKTISHLKWAHHTSILSFRVKKSLRMKLVTHRGLEDFFILCYAIIEGALWPFLSLVQECIIKQVPIKSYHAAFRSFGHRPTSPYWWQIGIQQQLYLKVAVRNTVHYWLWLALDLRCRAFLGIVTVSQACPPGSGVFTVHRDGRGLAPKCLPRSSWNISVQPWFGNITATGENGVFPYSVDFYTKMDTFKLMTGWISTHGFERTTEFPPKDDCSSVDRTLDFFNGRI